MSFLQWMAGAALVRRVADQGFHAYAQRRVARLDNLAADRIQRDTLLKLVRRAQHTRFGHDHGFDRIRSVEDYQRQVPLREYEAFWQEYWKASYPLLQGATWPEHVPYFALSSGTTSGTTKYLPVSRDMLASNRKAALTTLSYFLNSHPGAGVFRGRIFFLGGSTNLNEVDAKPQTAVRAGDLSGIAAVEISSLLRPYTFPPLDLALGADWERKVQTLAEHSAKLPITVLSGVPSWILVLFERLKRVTGKDRITDTWPTLRLVIHGGTKFDPYRTLFQRELGNDVALLETYPCSEGFVATEDPRHQLLRLVPDHGLFFEFVPVAELGKDRPTRHTLANLEPGVQYAVALTTCAGLWSYVLGDTVCFERRDPPLLRFTGRTRYYLSAFGEHLISEEVEKAVAAAAEACGALVTDFHVGPVFPELPSVTGHHRYITEFVEMPTDIGRFAAELDAALCRLNEDYKAHRDGSLSLAAPEVWPLPRGAFADWMRSQGKLGGQHKVPRMDNTGRITADLTRWAQERYPSPLVAT